MNRLHCFFSFLLLGILTSCDGAQPVNVTITVVGQDGFPVEGARVGVGFRSLGGKDVADSGLTNGKGIFIARGSSNYEFVAQISKGDYYPSELGRRSVKRKIAPGKWEVKDQEVTVVLRERRNPIPMYARANTTINLFEMNKAIGFDLLVFDWVAPHGGGKVSDLTFEISGYYNSRNDMDSTLTVRFPNEGDGAYAFEAVAEESEFISPYTAPESGYVNLLSLHKMAKPGDDLYSLVKESDVRGDRNYVIRFRTILDDNGAVKEAMYGKIYGDFDFAGAYKEGSYIRPKAYYINPTVNDRNLEYAVGENLVADIKSFNDPKKP